MSHDDAVDTGGIIITSHYGYTIRPYMRMYSRHNRRDIRPNKYCMHLLLKTPKNFIPDEHARFQHLMVHVIILHWFTLF